MDCDREAEGGRWDANGSVGKVDNTPRFSRAIQAATSLLPLFYPFSSVQQACSTGQQTQGGLLRHLSPTFICMAPIGCKGKGLPEIYLGRSVYIDTLTSHRLRMISEYLPPPEAQVRPKCQFILCLNWRQEQISIDDCSTALGTLLLASRPR